MPIAAGEVRLAAGHRGEHERSGSAERLAGFHLRLRIFSSVLVRTIMAGTFHPQGSTEDRYIRRKG